MTKILTLFILFFLSLDGYAQQDTDISKIITNPDVKEVFENIRWQWKNAPDKGGIKGSIVGIPVGSDAKYSVITSLKDYIDGNEESAFLKFLTGQKHAPSIQEMYKSARKKYGKNAFWTLVCSASYEDHPADLADATANVRWSQKNKAGDYKAARDAFKAGQNIRGMYYIMNCQAHNTSIQETYRATFRDKKKDFIALVQ